jgi:N-acetyl-alpha-D-muramate 1-phosphate uridylyltransferase
MKALILAAGRGQRMRPLTDHTPKPLLPVHGKPLIVWHLEALARGGVQDVVINTAWLEEQIPAALGDGARFGLRIHYSMEGRDHGGALETAGGIAKALPLLVDANSDAFWLVSGDIYAPEFVFDPAVWRRFAHESEPAARLAHLWLVPNPPYHPQGDFGLSVDGWGLADAPGADGQRHTYANLALCRAALCAGISVGTAAPLGPLLFEGMRCQRISAEMYAGRWENVGTPQQLAALNVNHPLEAGGQNPPAWL